MDRKEWGYILKNGYIQEKIYGGEGHIQLDLLMANPDILLVVLPTKHMKEYIKNMCFMFLEAEGYTISRKDNAT